MLQLEIYVQRGVGAVIFDAVALATPRNPPRTNRITYFDRTIFHPQPPQTRPAPAVRRRIPDTSTPICDASVHRVDRHGRRERVSLVGLRASRRLETGGVSPLCAGPSVGRGNGIETAASRRLHSPSKSYECPESTVDIEQFVTTLLAFRSRELTMVGATLAVLGTAITLFPGLEHIDQGIQSDLSVGLLTALGLIATVAGVVLAIPPCMLNMF